MSAFFKSAPVGIDISIQGFQYAMYAVLCAKWGLEDVATGWNCYGRAYRNQQGDGFTPEAFIGDENLNIEYQELYFDDKTAAISFFGMGDTSKYQATTATTPVYLIFSVDLTKLKPGIDLWRADEEVRNDVQQFCQVPRYNMGMTGWIVGIDSVFKEYSGTRKQEGIKNRDMQPRHCFRINFDLAYNINNCYKPIQKS